VNYKRGISTLGRSRSARVDDMTTEDPTGETLFVAVAEASGQTVEKVAMDLWLLDQAGALDPLWEPVEPAPRNQAERRYAARRGTRRH
jgi:hypothetical protein